MLYHKIQHRSGTNTFSGKILISVLPESRSQLSIIRSLANSPPLTSSNLFKRIYSKDPKHEVFSSPLRTHHI